MTRKQNVTPFLNRNFPCSILSLVSVISLTAAALHKWFVGSFFMPLLVCTPSQSLPFWGWQVHLNAPIMSQLRSLSRNQEEDLLSRNQEVAVKFSLLLASHCVSLGQLLLEEAESPQRSDYKITWRKALCFPTPFVHTDQQQCWRVSRALLSAGCCTAQ